MKQKLGFTIAALIFVFFAVTMRTAQVSAQQPTPMPGEPVPTPMPDLEYRIYKLEVVQDRTVQSLESINEQNRSLIIGAGTIIGVLVAIQGLATGAATTAQFVQLHREGRRDSRQANREEERDRIDRTGVEQVSKVMDVVQNTLASRIDIEHASFDQVSTIMDVVQRTLTSHLETEERAREAVEEAQGLVKQVGQFYQDFQMIISRARADIENRASQWAKTVGRHDFRGMTTALSSFAEQFDKFRTEFEALEKVEEGKLRPQFSPQVPYIRGIAAHYTNQPEIAKQYLEEVIRSREPLPGEDQRACSRRRANAYYYLGLTESNFGNNQRAIELFEEANELDLEARDFLTRAVTAEAYVMMNRFDSARKYADQIENRLQDIESREGRLRNFHLRLRSRARLIRANTALLERTPKWEEAQLLLESVHDTDPQYYYAIVTLAQVYYEQGELDKAQQLFDKAYMTIERSGDLLTVTETRTKVLLRMVAGMCCKHGPKDEDRADELLDQADNVLHSLPRIGNQNCTVFSTLSKRNESSNTIRRHIELIREGKVLLS